MKTFADRDISEMTIRSVLDACADCDTCRFLMDESCLFFPELYRLYDEMKERGREIAEDELRRLSGLCTLCGLCPCPDIRTDVIRGKTEKVRIKGMPLPVRLLADVQRFAQLGTLAPKLFNRVLSLPAVCRLAKKAAGIHPKRRLPRFSDERAAGCNLSICCRTLCITRWRSYGADTGKTRPPKEKNKNDPRAGYGRQRCRQ